MSALSPSELLLTGETGSSPLFHPGWLEFNRQKWGAVPRAIHLARDGAARPAIDAVYYLDRRGRIVHPPLNPYLPVRFTSTPTRGRTRLYRQWTEAAAWLVAEMQDRGLRSTVALPPGVTDVRAWQWAGFRASVRYTFILDLPYTGVHQDPMVRNRIASATRRGYRCETDADLADVLTCLRETERRQGFEHQLELGDLERARACMGAERFRTYACYDSGGKPVSSFIALHEPGGEAIGWAAGVDPAHQGAGASQLVMHHALADLATAGALSLDWAGANIAGVAAAKANWGPRFEPYYVVEAPNLRGLAKYLQDGLRFATAS